VTAFARDDEWRAREGWEGWAEAEAESAGVRVVSASELDQIASHLYSKDLTKSKT
jgi:hypothetical protein